MIKKTWPLVALSAGAMACSSGSSTDFGGNGSGDDASSGGSGSSSGSGTSSGSGSDPSSDGGMGIPADAAVHYAYGDASLVPDAELDTPVTLMMDAFEVPANSEVYKCQQFGNPFGKPVDLVKFDGYMSPGSHHFFLFNMGPETFRNQAAPFGDCPGGGIEFHPYPYLSQTAGHYVVTYPQANMGYPIGTDHGLMMNVHYLNTSSKPLPVQASIVIYPAKDGLATTKVGSIFLNQTSLKVEWGEDHVWHSNTTTPTAEAYTIFTHWSHMHKWATDFQALINNNVVYDETNWSEPTLITQANDPRKLLPIQVAANTPITYKCQYTNNGSAYQEVNLPTGELTFGDSAKTNVMCIYMAQYYPADRSAPSYPDIVQVLQ